MAKTIADYQKDYAAAQARGDQKAMADAHAGAEAERAKQGYSGGADGSRYIPTGQGGGAQGIDYQALINDALSRNDYNSAALFERQRNLKIDAGHGGGYEKTYYYQGEQTNPGSTGLYDGNVYEEPRAATQAYDDSALRAYIQQLEEENQRRTQAAVAQGTQALQQQLPGIQQSYDAAARQAYIQYMNARKDLPQQLAAAGISGQGAAESTLSGQANAYGAVLGQSELARRNAEQQVQNQIANLQATGDLQYADNAADIGKLALEAYQNYLAQYQAQANAQTEHALRLAGLTGQIGGVNTLGWYQQQNENQAMDASRQAQAYDQQARQWQRALQNWAMYGMVLNAEDAALLGVPVGTPNSDQRYQDAQLKLNQYLAYR